MGRDRLVSTGGAGCPRAAEAAPPLWTPRREGPTSGLTSGPTVATRRGSQLPALQNSSGGTMCLGVFVLPRPALGSSWCHRTGPGALVPFSAGQVAGSFLLVWGCSPAPARSPLHCSFPPVSGRTCWGAGGPLQVSPQGDGFGPLPTNLQTPSASCSPRGWVSGDSHATWVRGQPRVQAVAACPPLVAAGVCPGRFAEVCVGGFLPLEMLPVVLDSTLLGRFPVLFWGGHFSMRIAHPPSLWLRVSSR